MHAYEVQQINFGSYIRRMIGEQCATYVRTYHAKEEHCMAWKGVRSPTATRHDSTAVHGYIAHLRLGKDCSNGLSLLGASGK